MAASLMLGRRFRLRAQSVGLVAFGTLIGAASVAALNQSENQSYSAVSLEAFANCRDAIQAGAAPLHRGDPGYAPHLDADGDGIACEPYRRR